MPFKHKPEGRRRRDPTACMFKLLHKVSGGKFGAKSVCVDVRTGVGKRQGEGREELRRGGEGGG